MSWVDKVRELYLDGELDEPHQLEAFAQAVDAEIAALKAKVEDGRVLTESLCLLTSALRAERDVLQEKVEAAEGVTREANNLYRRLIRTDLKLGLGYGPGVVHLEHEANAKALDDLRDALAAAREAGLGGAPNA